MTRDAVIDRVVTKMDELTPFDEGLVISSGNDGVLPIRSYIDELLDECTREHLLLCPLDKIDDNEVEVIGSPVVNGTQLELTKPSDYIKIFYIKHSTWERPVTKVLTKEDPRYVLQFNTFTKGGKAKPQVIEEGDKLIGFSVSSGAAATGTYEYVSFNLPEAITDDRTIDFISLLTAHKVFAVMGEMEHSKALLELYTRYISA